MEKTNKEKFLDFIRENNINIKSEGSALNSACCILAGFALHIGIDDSEVYEILNNSDRLEISTSEFDEEFGRVYEYAAGANYGAFWNTPEARKMYKF